MIMMIAEALMTNQERILAIVVFCIFVYVVWMINQ